MCSNLNFFYFFYNFYAVMYLITTQQNDYPLSGLVSKGRVWHKFLIMQTIEKGLSLLRYREAGFKFILGGSRGIPAFILEAIKKEGSIIIELQGLKSVVESTSKEFALTIFRATYDNQEFEAMLPLSLILADGPVRVTSEKVILKSTGKPADVLRVLGFTVNNSAVKEVNETDVWAAVERLEGKQQTTGVTAEKVNLAALLGG